jgi:hypothetical protein
MTLLRNEESRNRVVFATSGKYKSWGYLLEKNC